MKIAILTMFNGLDVTYSLVGVVYEHITMLLQAGISVRMLVSEDCPDSARYGVFADPIGMTILKPLARYIIIFMKKQTK
ncbi:MAG: hypothetical protein RR086_04495 [Clostridia bacterium]